MNYFEKVAKSKNYSEIELVVWDNNPAKNFYKKLGYQIALKKDHKYLMVKSLQQTSNKGYLQRRQGVIMILAYVSYIGYMV